MASLWTRLTESALNSSRSFSRAAKWDSLLDYLSAILSVITQSYLTDSPYRPNLLLSNSWAWSWNFSKELSVWRWLQFQIWSSVFDTWTSMILRQLEKITDYICRLVFPLKDSVGSTVLVTISAPEMMKMRCQVLRAPFSVTGFSRNKSVLVKTLSFTYSQSKSESGISTIGFFFCPNKSKEIWFL